uniref:Uncharacterized protein n=1 Tax=Arundo donax TaxID=35708 RepID=A0A0A9GFY0_ARUDO
MREAAALHDALQIVLKRSPVWLAFQDNIFSFPVLFSFSCVFHVNSMPQCYWQTAAISTP